jgi:hypothetical protein
VKDQAKTDSQRPEGGTEREISEGGGLGGGVAGGEREERGFARETPRGEARPSLRCRLASATKRAGLLRPRSFDLMRGFCQPFDHVTVYNASVHSTLVDHLQCAL